MIVVLTSVMGVVRPTRHDDARFMVAAIYILCTKFENYALTITA